MIYDEFISQGTNLSSVFGLFQLANYIRDYPDGNYYPLIKHEATYTSYPQIVDGSLNHLSSNFYAFKADALTSTLTLTFTNMNSDSLAVKLILNKLSGDYDIKDVTLDNPSVTIQITNVGTSSIYSKVVVIVMNISSSQDGETYSISASKETSSSLFGEDEDGGGTCFIATAAYGSYLDPHVKVLRDFRDRYLITNPFGKAFVMFYYKVSPNLANYIKEHETLRIVTRFTLTPIVYGVKYPQITLLLITLLIGFVSFKRWRR